MKMDIIKRKEYIIELDEYDIETLISAIEYANERRYDKIWDEMRVKLNDARYKPWT